MRLFVSLAGSTVNELRFDRGPIYIGRQMGCQVFLPDRMVSRQHAVLYTTKDGIWMLEDLGTPNKTYLNDVAIHKSEVKDGDIIRIADFIIRISFSDDIEQERKEMEDTLVGQATLRKELHTLDRRYDTPDAPPIRLPPKRLYHLNQAMVRIGSVTGLQPLHKILMDLLFDQFMPKNVWIGLRKTATGGFDVQGGRQISTQSIDRLDLALPNSLAETIEYHHYLLIHQMPRQVAARGIRSVMISPVMLMKDSFGVLYLENSTEHSHYSLADLDYLALLGMFAAYTISKLPA